MNFLKRMLGANRKDTLVALSHGQLVLLRSPELPKSESECVYNEAHLTIRQTTAPFHYQLVVRKASEEPEERIKDEDSEEYDALEEPLEELSFLISELLYFHKTINAEGNTAIVWKDISGDEGDKYSFVCDLTVAEPDIDKFMLALWRCEYEFKYSRSAVALNDEDLREFQFEPSDHENLSDSLFTDLGAQGEPDPVDVMPPGFAGLETKVASLGAALYSVKCGLFEYDHMASAFVSRQSDVRLDLVELGEWSYGLVFYTSEGHPYCLVKIDQGISGHLNSARKVFTFNMISASEASSWLVQFNSSQDFSEFEDQYAQALWEATNQKPWKKVSKHDQDYIVDAFGDMHLEEYADTQEKFSDSETESESDSEEEAKRPAFEKDTGASNKELVISYNDGLTYVTRKDKIGVFRPTEDSKDLEFQTTIQNIKTPKGHRINPEKLMLHTGGTSLLMKDPSVANTVYKMDLNRGKIVEQYNMKKDGEDVNVVQINPNTKYAQLTDEKTFMGISPNSVFKIDPRLPGNNLVESQMKSYLTKTGFSSLAATEDGAFAVVGEEGEIKLFDRLGINAKTRLPGLGGNAKAISVSADGRWVLVTFSTYLLLVDVKIKGGPNKGETGFHLSFTKTKKPTPITLSLSPEHIAQIRRETGKPVNFTAAQFNTGLNVKESSIISSTGPYAVQWSLRKVLKGDLAYKIVRHGTDVIADSFAFGDKKHAIVALNDDVRVVHQRKFKNPEEVL